MLHKISEFAALGRNNLVLFIILGCILSLFPDLTHFIPTKKNNPPPKKKNNELVAIIIHI